MMEPFLVILLLVGLALFAELCARGTHGPYG